MCNYWAVHKHIAFFRTFVNFMTFYEHWLTICWAPQSTGPPPQCGGDMHCVWFSISDGFFSPRVTWDKSFSHENHTGGLLSQCVMHISHNWALSCILHHILVHVYHNYISSIKRTTIIFQANFEEDKCLRFTCTCLFYYYWQMANTKLLDNNEHKISQILFNMSHIIN